MDNLPRNPPPLGAERFKKQEQIRARLTIDPDTLDQCLITQPMDFLEASDEAAVAMSLRDKAKDELSQLEAQLQFIVREELEAEMGKKPTEALVTAAIIDHEDFQASQTHYRELKEVYDHWAALKDAFIQRGHALRELANLYISGYFAENSVTGNQQGALDRKASTNKKRAAEKRSASTTRAKDSARTTTTKKR